MMRRLLQLVTKSVFSSPPKKGEVGGGMTFAPAIATIRADELVDTLPLTPSNLEGELT